MLKVIYWASLKLSGSLLARKATRKLMKAKRLRYPNMAQKAMTEPSLHSKLINLNWYLVLSSGNGGASDCQEIHKISCKREQMDIIRNETQGLVHLLNLLPGLVAMKAKTTMMVLAKMQEIQRVKIMPNAECLRRHVSFWGGPMKAKEQKKQRVKERRRRQLRL